MSIFDRQINLKPNKYPWSTTFIHAMWHNAWSPSVFSFQSDVLDFRTRLTPEDQRVIVNSLSAISQIEVQVKQFWKNLGDNLPHPSLIDLGVVMANVEVVHNHAYVKLLETLGLDAEVEKALDHEVLLGRVNYLNKHIHRYYENSRKQFLYSLILFTLYVENVSLFWQFYVILHFNRFNNVLKDTAQQVQYTKNEELLHAQAGIKIINTIRQEHPELFDAELEDLIRESSFKALRQEVKVIEWAIGDYDHGKLNKSILYSYTAHRINESLKAIGFEPLFEVEGVAALRKDDWMWMEEEILAPAMTDFFHKKPVEYSKSHTSIQAGDLW